MGPKRAAKGEPKGSAAKRIKKEKADCESRWEFEGDKQTWTQYSSALNDILTDASVAKKKQVDFELDNGCKMCVRFDKMVQKNKKSGWERPVRLAVKDSTDDAFYVWCWEDEKLRNIPYGAQVALDLEKAKQDGDSSYDFVACERSYTVDIGSMEQENTVTNVRRKVLRRESKAVKADPEAPVPVSSSTPDTPVKGKGAAKSGAGKSKGKAKAEPVDDDDEEDKSAGKSGVKAGKSGGARPKSGPKERPAVKTFVMSGKAPVDPECTTLVHKAHVFYEGKDVYDCMLNQTSVSNNNNKYFLIQLLEENDKKSYYTWFRWGRVGYSGQNNLVPCGPSLEQAKKLFMKKFTDKTKNDWSNRSHFVKVPGKYDLLEMDYSSKDGDEVDAPVKSEKNEKVPDSKLDKRLQNLIELICDVKSMEDAVMEMQYDAKKAPLGKLTSDQVKAGYSALKKIDDCIEKKDFGSALTHACDEFYTRIPHDFGMRPPEKINTKQQVKQKLELLEALGDIQIALRMLKEGDKSENPVDRHYHAMKCDLEPMDHSCKEYKMIDQYLQNTHASTHNQYKMKLMEVYKVDKETEKKQFKDCGNRQLLWHGSRLTNWMGILSQGLRIAPPEAPVTGYMFGKGVYFADMSSKSANYCFATKNKNVGLMLLCDVALGSTNDLLAADYKADKLPSGKNSVRGAGKIAPDPSHTTTTDEGALVPWGKPKDTDVVNPKGYTLNYNEFIVYDTKQIKMKYLLKVNFGFK